MLLNDDYMAVKTYSEYKRSYRGFVSWMLLANSNHYFLVDGIALRDYLEETRKVYFSLI
jgi:hypothetical protein